MIITTIGKNRITSVTLPEKIMGQYWLYSNENGSDSKLITVEGINGQWLIKSNRNAKVLGANGQPLKSMVLESLKVYTIKKSSGELIFVSTEPITSDRQTFTKYLVKDNIDMAIGRSERNDICFDNPAVSAEHAVLSYRNHKWYVNDLNSTNGTFVNEARASEQELKIGDIVFVMGLKIIVGKNFVAFNDPDNKTKVSDKLKKYVSQPIDPGDEEDDDVAGVPDKFFYRSPRFKRDIETATFKIDSPPTSPMTEELPWILVMGSSMAMGVMSLITLISALVTFNITSMAMGGSMLIGTVMLPIITKKYEKKRKRKKEALRQKKYKAYLDKVAVQIDEACHLQEEILNENFITVGECEKIIENTQRNLWERGLGQNDFLRVRVGHGEGRLDAELLYSERHFSLDDDNLQEELYSLCEKENILHNIPITYSLFDDYISGIIGERSKIIEFAKGLIVQIAALYSYDEVKFVFLYDQSDQKEFEFVKWLPHVWNDERTFRFIATNTNEAKEISAHLERIIESRKDISEKDMEDVKPYYIVFSLSKALAVRSEMIKQILAKKENMRISIVTFYGRIMDLPKECSMVVELGEQGGRLFDKNDITGKSTAFIPDIRLNTDPLSLSVALANTQLDVIESNYQFPKTISFLEMFGVGKAEHLNATERWKENDPTKSLEAAVGVDVTGELLKLDLHEKFHGPHGLVAGMTGSGKSEFIITYILSLAVNYHPNEVAFILIDYKGGGMAKSFEHLPHTAGIITNLDGAAIKRSLISIESELKRRQAIFAAASKKIGVSNIDIYKYQKLYREGTVSEPLQHLFIISDEFAELKTQQPEFMTQLVSAARIGRSLGVHLILATQKPSGVVDDQIWSNSKFKICLKVQERADSMDMLRRPDAAELKDTGRFYLQVGYNELFEIGQSAWSGAPYYPSDKVIKHTDNSVIVIDNNGHQIKQVGIDKRKSMFGNAKKQLDVITEYLKNIADEENIKIRPLWLDPIPKTILLSDVSAKYSITEKPYNLNPLIGEFDDPIRQRQCALRVPISDEGNVIVYGSAGSGKTTFLNAMLSSLICGHTPEEVNIYILDFASETLRAFSKAPHVGDVVLSYEAEKISNLFRMLQSEIEKRKKLFADFGGDYEAYISTSGHKLPSIVITINNFAAFTEIYEEKEEAVSYISREGTKYGIYFVLTSLGVGGVRFKMLQNFKQLFVLQLNDESDYSTIVGKTEGLVPTKCKGRGLVRTDGLYEFQTAELTKDEVPFGCIQSMCEELAQKYSGERAKRIPLLPSIVDREFLKDYVKHDELLNIPIGVEKNSLNVHYYPFFKSYINMIMSAGNDCQDFICSLAHFVDTDYNIKGVLFDLPKTSNDELSNIKLCANSGDCEQEISNLFDTVLYRNNTYKESEENHTECERFEPYIVFINSISSLRNSLSDKGNERLSLVLEKGRTEYGITVVIADQSKSTASFSYEGWYKANVSDADGIWVGSGITEQYQIRISKASVDLRDDLTSEFGYSIKKGRCVKLKLLSGETEE